MVVVGGKRRAAVVALGGCAAARHRVSYALAPLRYRGRAWPNSFRMASFLRRTC